MSIVFTDNIGPHRKLIPLLWHKWHEDCVLVTSDDDIATRDLRGRLFQLLKYYVGSKKGSIVALRSRRIGICREEPHSPTKYSRWTISSRFGSIETMQLPTGTGGILYRPRFFHPIVFDNQLRELTELADDLHFRLATLANDVPVTSACHPKYNRGARCPIEITLFNNTFKNIINDDGIFNSIRMSKEREKLDLLDKRRHLTIKETIDGEEEEGKNNNYSRTKRSVRKLLNVRDTLLNISLLNTPHSKARENYRIPINRYSNLYQLNYKENDSQFEKGLMYLKEKNILHFDQLSRKYVFPEGRNNIRMYRERDARCYSSSTRSNLQANVSSTDNNNTKKSRYARNIDIMCALQQCNK